MYDLIVPFPKQRCNSSIGKQPGKKMVQFSPTSELLFFECVEHADMHKIWYTGSDLDSMKLATRQAVLEVHTMERSIRNRQTIDENGTALDGDSCITTGIENMLTLEIMKKVRAAKERHRGSVLLEQAMQVASGECDPERLSNVSQYYSTWSVQRAVTIGMLQGTK